MYKGRQKRTFTTIFRLKVFDRQSFDSFFKDLDVFSRFFWWLDFGGKFELADFAYFKKNPGNLTYYFDDYSNEMRDMLEKGLIRIVGMDNMMKPRLFLTHHPVVKPDSESRKVHRLDDSVIQGTTKGSRYFETL